MNIAVSGAAGRRKIRTVPLSAAVLLAVMATLVCLTAFGRSAEQRVWLPSWSAAQMVAVEVWEPNWSTTGFADHTVRQTIRPTLGGDRARITLSNLFGDRPLRIAGASLAQAAPGASVRPGTVRPVSFAGAPVTEIAPGAEFTSDAVDFAVTAREPITVTLYLPEVTGRATFHDLSNATSYRARSDHHADNDGRAFTEPDESWYYLSDLRVSGAPADNGVVAFGDSLTDGAKTTTDSDNRYPDVLADRLAVDGDTRAVLNAGIGGNRIVSESAFVGQRAATRFRRDVLDKDGVGTVILLSGINDIGAARLDSPWLRPNPDVTPEQLIAGYQQLIGLARDDGLRIIGGTLPPYGGATYYSEHGETVRDRVNTWTRESGEFDAVVDFDRLLAAGSDPDVLAPRYDSGDHLHPNPAGYAAMADAALVALTGAGDRDR